MHKPGWIHHWSVREAVAILPVDHRARRDLLPYVHFELAEAWPHLAGPLQSTLAKAYLELCLGLERELEWEEVLASGARPVIRRKPRFIGAEAGHQMEGGPGHPIAASIAARGRQVLATAARWLMNHLFVARRQVFRRRPTFLTADNRCERVGR